VPQETIFFDNADLVLDHEVRLEKDASYIGCEILCFGRTAFGELFSGGRIRQRNRIYRDGKLIWLEQIRLLGGSPAMHGSLALAGRTVCATLIVAGKTIPRELIETAREEAAGIAGEASCIGISQLKSAVVARYLGDSSETARGVMLHVWGLFRPAMLGRPAIVPRMWNT
jgi:urease accessory protein